MEIKTVVIQNTLMSLPGQFLEGARLPHISNQQHLRFCGMLLAFNLIILLSISRSNTRLEKNLPEHSSDEFGDEPLDFHEQQEINKVGSQEKVIKVRR